MLLTNKIDVLLAGETWIVHKTHIKGFDKITLGGYEDFSVHFRDAMDDYSEINLTHIPNHLVLSDFPRTPEALNDYDVVILSDVGSNSLTLYPEFFEVPMGPDRLESIRKYVEDGGGLLMAGGWMSYQGYQRKAGYHNTPVEEALPVKIKDVDDRVEVTEGIAPEIVEKESVVFDGIEPDKWPKFLGYNSLEEDEDSNVLARIGEDEPFISLRSYGEGKTMAFASDLAPHWGTDFVDWEYYPKFWLNSLKWLSGSD